MKLLRNLLVQPSFIFGAFTFSLVVLFALLAPLVLPLDPHAQDSLPFLQPGQPGHLLGTDNLGQDVFARLVYGIRTSLMVGLLAGLFATALGTLIGLVGGYKGGWIDNTLSLATNLFLVVPQLVVLILISSSLNHRSYLLVALIIGLSSWTWVARAVSAQASSLRNREHIQLAKLNGFGDFNIILRQVMPYALSYIFMAFIMQLTSGILSESALSMLGLGPQSSEAVSLGSMLNDAYKCNALEERLWWVFLPPTLAITAIAFALYVVNTAMEDVFNPRLRK